MITAMGCLLARIGKYGAGEKNARPAFLISGPGIF
jgi:hypothetical protein